MFSGAWRERHQATRRSSTCLVRRWVNLPQLQLPPHLVTAILPSDLTFWNQPESVFPANLPVPPVDFHVPFSAPAPWDHSMLCVCPSLSWRAQCPLERAFPSGVVSAVPEHWPVTRL